MPNRHAPRRSPAALAIALLLAALPGAPLHAQDTPQEIRQRYAIAAGTLEDVLTRFAASAGIALSFDPALVTGLRSPGLSGDYTGEEGLRRVLAGSGLAAQPRGEGGYTLYRLPAPAGEAVLAPVRVIAATEGSGSYTTNLTNTATKLDLSLRETPQSVTVVTRKRMEDQSLDEVAKVLDQTVGIHFHNTNVPGADMNQMYSRGFPLENYQVNGVPRSTRFGFQDDIADTVVYDRAEIVRGASGLLNGIGEPSGAVNLVRKLPTRDFQAHAAVRYGSWDLYRAEVDVSGALNEAGSVRGRLVGGYQTNDTFVDRVNMEKEVLYGIVEADLTPSTILSLGIEYQKHKTSGAGDAYSGAPLFFADGSRTGFSHGTNLSADWASTTRENLNLFSTLEHYFDNDWRLRLDLEHIRRKYDMVLPSLVDLEPSGDAGLLAFRWAGKPRQDSISLHANGPYQLFGRSHELVVGASYMRGKENGKNYDEFYDVISNAFDVIRTGNFPRQGLSPDGSGYSFHDEQSGLYAATRLNPFDKVHVILGSRLSNWKTRTDRYNAAGVTTRGRTNEESSVLTPYAGIVVDLTDSLSVYGSYTDIFQPSTRSDASGNLLDPAEGSNLEAGLKLAFFDDRLNLSAAVYRTKKDNVPEYVPGPGGTVNFGPTGEYVYEGIDGTKTTGLELEVAGQLTPDWQISGGYSHARLRDAEGKARLTYLPSRTFKLFTSYRLLPQLTLGANLRWQNGIHSERNHGYRQGSLALVDLMAQYEITRDLTATLNVNNAFDKTYYTDINVSGWYGAPRSAYLNLRYAF
ncbi:TonB-dependent siderophore receptor [Pseudothauera nasutitermitis]|uniref:TonB-dependent siderophore receptor n=1 Tax=Pseudothauera nasutitermitis TaxID=2565930 RepID=A0A4S4B1X4_9RHOO|nr:TonB-dependent receptor [Pseudothauera nasutitermitis]THF66185.1 TonB-dependent siderophore receptor [Pseudothauera nasutitermitis]